MPVGSNGQIRPNSTMSAVIIACKIATGKIEEKYGDEEHRQHHRRQSFTLAVKPREEDEG